MDLQQWQQEFETWLSEHHLEQDAAHDIFHFRRVWATAQKLCDHETVDGLVVLTACYFHDIVSLPKNHPERHRSSVLAAKEANRILRNDFPLFPPARIPAVVHAIEAHSFSAKIAPATLEAKIVQDADTGWKPSAQSAWPAYLRYRARWAWHCLTAKILLPGIVPSTINSLPSTISRANYWCCRKPCRQPEGKHWRSTMPISWWRIWRNWARN